MGSSFSSFEWKYDKICLDFVNLAAPHLAAVPSKAITDTWFPIDMLATRPDIEEDKARPYKL
jgi:hypothetical protein